MAKDKPQIILAKELKDYKKNSICIINTAPENYHAARLALLEELSNKLKLQGLYVTLNMPGKAIETELKDKGISPQSMMILEGLNQKTGMSIGLVELSIKVTTLMNTGKYEFIILDSASTLLISNSMETIERFLSFMINKIRHLEKHLYIIFITDEKSQKVANLISQSCDKYIKL